MGSQIIVQDTILEIDENIEYVFNTSNVADMSLSKSNYTEAFKIPRLSRVAVKLFNGLGIPADISGVPYMINKADVLDNYAKVYSGNLVVLKSTPEYYESTVISGTFNVFSLLGDKTFADIPEVVGYLPLKTVENVANLATVPKTPAIFAIANYGGITHVNDGELLSLNVDCMPVAYNIQYLWEAIFRFIGVTQFITNDVPNLNDQYFTFPYPPLGEISAFGAQQFAGTVANKFGFIDNEVTEVNITDWINVSNGGFTRSGGDIVCNVAGTYNFTFSRYYAFGMHLRIGNYDKFKLTVLLLKNGVEFYRFQSQISDEITDEYYINTVQRFATGDAFSIRILREETVYGSVWGLSQYESPMKITTVQLSQESLSTILGFKLADFVKEFMYRFGLVGFATENNVTFKNMKNILEGTVVDWSDKYDRRIDESYDLGWNQNNYLRHKYVSENSEYYDLNITTNNQNLAPTRDIITSSVYVPSQNASLYPVSGNGATVIQTNVRGYVTYTVDNSNNVKTEKRNFWLEADPLVLSQVRFGSYQLPDRITLTNTSMYVAYDFNYSFLNSDVWRSMSKIVVGTKLHTIELSLTSVDIATLIQWNLIYFKQESAYYMISELRYKNKEKATGKFIKVNNIIYGQ